MHFQKSKIEIALVQKVFKGKCCQKVSKIFKISSPCFFTPTLLQIYTISWNWRKWLKMFQYLYVIAWKCCNCSMCCMTLCKNVKLTNQRKNRKEIHQTQRKYPCESQVHWQFITNQLYLHLNFFPVFFLFNLNSFSSRWRKYLPMNYLAR